MKEELFEGIDGENFSDEAEVIQLVGLKLGDEEYAIDVLKIQEIIRSVEITIVPRMENYILGVMNLRGKVIPVIDLRIRFSLDRSDFDKATRIIVVRFEKQNIGFVVDEVTEVIRIKKAMVEPTPPLVGSIGQEYILGICTYDSRLIMLLDIDRVINESGEQLESELRKKMLGTSSKSANPFTAPPVAETPPVSQPAVQETHEKEEKQDLPAPDQVPSPLVSAFADNNPQEEHEKEDAFTKGSADSDVEDDIDALIAKELAKREEETDSLNKKKRSKQDESPEDILGDALKQSAAIFEQGSQGHIEQDDLDSLIAQELAKREAETDELNQKNREDKKKNSNINLDIVDPNAVPQVEIISYTEKTELADLSDVVRQGGAKAAEPETARKISVSELKTIAEKIISGEKPEELDLDVKGEVGELLRLIIDTKAKVDEIDPMLEASGKTLPGVASVLEDVDKSTEAATMNLVDASGEMSSFYKELAKGVSDLQALAVPGKEDEFNKCQESVYKNLGKAEDLGFKILESLEFQDITEQKLRKVINSIEDMGGRIGAIVGYLQVRHGTAAPSGRMDKLLSDYGLV